MHVITGVLSTNFVSECRVLFHIHTDAKQDSQEHTNGPRDDIQHHLLYRTIENDYMGRLDRKT